MKMCKIVIIVNRKVINALHEENNELVSNLKVMQTEKRCLSDKRQAQRVVQLFEQGVSVRPSDSNQDFIGTTSGNPSPSRL